MFRYGSSFRSRALTETLDHAKRFAAQLGISRVTDITRLDRIGLPVFAGVRPEASRDSLCVHAGKGLNADEARVGAYMEAIEFAYAEPGASGVPCRAASARDVLDGRSRPEAILDLCPSMRAEIPLDEPLQCVPARDERDRECLVPAELVFHPFYSSGRQYFGSDTNGLASGNDVMEASLHAMLELVERDICSFQAISDTTALVVPDSLPPAYKELQQHIQAAGFHAVIRNTPNIFGIPHFVAALWERDLYDPRYVNTGYGCHPDPQIALTRAVTEAAQSRLSIIHGARDDLEPRFRKYEDWSVELCRRHVATSTQRLADDTRAIDFDAVLPLGAGSRSIDDLFGVVATTLKQLGFELILRVIFTRPDDAIQVVRVIIPGLEHFNELSARVGTRLRDYAASA